MIDKVLISYFLWFLVILAGLMYTYIALANKAKVNVDFFGTKKSMTVRSLLVVCVLDGVGVGLLLYYLISSSFF
jgi:uncharacterized integral membrane protein